ncbi:MAG: alpha/beta hydrolase-fold protein [Planctomycetota bacterium]
MYAALCRLILLVIAGTSCAQRVDVPFEIEQQTSIGESVFLVGSLPELGAGDVTRAVRLEPSGYPAWRGSISLPANTDYTYRAIVRRNAAGLGDDPTNAMPVSTEAAATTPSGSGAAPAIGVYARLHFASPVLHWRQEGSGGGFQTLRMIPVAVGREPGELLWYAPPVGTPGADTEWFIRDLPAGASSGPKTPVFGNFETSLTAAFIQDHEVYTYVPSNDPARPRRDYNASTPPSLFSPSIGETRRYRVFLPRGYDEHPQRRYPVLYMHDGQNVFEAGAFGSWNSDFDLEVETAAGRAREIIVVAVDHTDRFRDYIPGYGSTDYGDFLQNELKPVIDAQYRTLPSREHTGVAGSSLGGLISFSLGWDRPSFASRIGAFSGSWQVVSFASRARTEPKRDARFYIDSGDSGPSNDNHDRTYALRDAMMARAIDPYVLEGDLRHRVGYDQQHNEAAWDARFPDMLGFLFPASEADASQLAALPGPTCLAALRSDVNGDGNATPADFTAWVIAFNSRDPAADQNGDGLIAPADFTSWVLNYNSVCRP